MPLYEVPQPEPETPAEATPAVDEPVYDDAAVMAECQRLTDSIAAFQVPVAYSESRVNLTDLAPTMQMRAVVRCLLAMGITQAQWTQAVHEELRDTLRTVLADLEAKRDQQPKGPALELPPGYRKH